MEYELLDTGLFDEDRYFDVFVEYAKEAPTDILIQISVCNRGPEHGLGFMCCPRSGSAISGHGGRNHRSPR